MDLFLLNIVNLDGIPAPYLAIRFENVGREEAGKEGHLTAISTRLSIWKLSKVYDDGRLSKCFNTQIHVARIGSVLFARVRGCGSEPCVF